MRWLTIKVSLAAVLFCPAAAFGYSELFVDGHLMVNDETITHVNDSNTTGEPVYVHLPDLAPGTGSSISSAAAVEGGTISDLTLHTLSLKSRASLGAVTTTDQIWLRGQAKLETSFEIAAAGEQTISVGMPTGSATSSPALATTRLAKGGSAYDAIWRAVFF